MKDFTCGLSAELVAQYIAAFDSMIKGEAVSAGSHAIVYYDTKEYLQYVVECINHFGFYSTQSERSTRNRALEYLTANKGRTCDRKFLEQLLEEMKEVSFNYDTVEVAETVDSALVWIASQDEESNYIHNVKVLASQQYITSKDLGFVASLIPTYCKAMKREQDKRERQVIDSKSDYVGNVGDRITVEIQSVECVASWETQFGYTFVHKMTDEQGNVYIWKTGRGISEQKVTITGTIKEHKEFKGIKQTELTRCRAK